MHSDPQITQLLVQLRDSEDDNATLSEELYRALYPRLHEMADRMMLAERADHTLQATALVNEAYLRLVDQNNTDWESRTHFLAIAARLMRRILTDHARSVARKKRGGGWARVALHDDLAQPEVDPDELIHLDGALERLRKFSERMVRVVELRVFSGMTVKEIAHVLGISKRTADDDWSFARRWLSRELTATDGSSD